MDELKVYKSKAKAVLGAVTSGLIVFGCTTLLDDPEIPTEVLWSCWVLIFAFSTAPIAFFWNLFDRRPFLIVNKQGIFSRITHDDFIPWESIQSVQLVHVIYFNWNLSLLVDPSFVPSKKKRWYQKGFLDFKKLSTVQEFSIPIGHLAIKRKDLIRFIENIQSSITQEELSNIEILDDQDFRF